MSRVRSRDYVTCLRYMLAIYWSLTVISLTFPQHKLEAISFQLLPRLATSKTQSISKIAFILVGDVRKKRQRDELICSGNSTNRFNQLPHRPSFSLQARRPIKMASSESLTFLKSQLIITIEEIADLGILGHEECKNVLPS